MGLVSFRRVRQWRARAEPSISGNDRLGEVVFFALTNRPRNWDALLFHMDQMSQWGRSVVRQSGKACVCTYT